MTRAGNDPTRDEGPPAAPLLLEDALDVEAVGAEDDEAVLLPLEFPVETASCPGMTSTADTLGVGDSGLKKSQMSIVSS